MLGKAGTNLRSRVLSFHSALLRLAGMPDYRAYVEHLHRYHPERSVPTQGEFYEEFLRAHYGDNPTRCC
jgi:uncharacterized short protein YbdD (DUF466 family)